MMKRIFVFLILMITTTCFANKYDDVKQDSTFEMLQEYTNLMKQQLPIIEERMKKIDPEFVESLQSDTDIQKVVKYNNYLAEKTFNDYKDFFVWLMEQKSLETGREIKQQIYGNGKETFYWLDEGIMDSEQCKGHVVYRNKNNGRYEVTKMLRDERKHTCLYPDNFEEYKMVYQDFGSPYLNVSIDDMSTNIRAEYVVSLTIKTSSNNPDNISNFVDIDVSKFIYDYQDFHTWRNQVQQDIKDGMYQYVPKKKQNCNSTFGCQIIEAKDLAKWKSSKLPATKITGISSNQSLSYTHTYTESID